MRQLIDDRIEALIRFRYRVRIRQELGTGASLALLVETSLVSIKLLRVLDTEWTAEVNASLCASLHPFAVQLRLYAGESTALRKGYSSASVCDCRRPHPVNS
jgi:hypothetical protein